jgi:FlaA1/EpsC-like NDP-sugar epimerase
VEEFKVNVPIEALYKTGAIDELSTIIHNPSAYSADSDNELQDVLGRDSVLDVRVVDDIRSTLRVSRNVDITKGNNILLTGATGFLGSFLLNEMLLSLKGEC